MSKSLPDYTAFTVTDFVLDHHFVKWVQNPSEGDNAFWQNWLDENPAKRNTITDARILISHVRFSVDYNSSDDIDRSWAQLSEHFDAQKRRGNKVWINWKTYLKYAAVFAILALAAGYSYFKPINPADLHTYETGNGETVVFKLSDSSQVILNANSSMKIAMRSGLFPKREAWVTGEAFFKIKKKKIPLSFTVHTPRVDIRVLGTEFNVSDRRDLSTVVLQSGQIKINNTAGRIHELIMKPGDLAAFSDTSRSFVLRHVDPDQYSSWIYQKLIFDHTPIADVAQMLEDNYGLSVVIAKPALAKKTFTATLPSDSLPVLLKALEESFNLQITQLDKKLIITDK